MADVVDLIVAEVSVVLTVEAVVDAIGDTDTRDLIDVTIVVGTNLPLELFAVVTTIESEVAVDEMTEAEKGAETDDPTDVESDLMLGLLEDTFSREIVVACCGRPGTVRGGVNGKMIDFESLVEDT